MTWTFSDGKETDKVIELYCNKCGDQTNHEVLRAIRFSDSEDVGNGGRYSVDWGGEAQILDCRGCGEFAFRVTHWFSEDDPYDRREPSIFPPRHQVTPSQLYLRDDLERIPEPIQSTYKETLSAAQAGLVILATFGIRSIVEGACKDKNAKGGNLEKKIDSLHEQGLLTKDGAESLHALRFLGNTAAHELKPPKQGQLLVALRVIDHLLLGAYVLPAEAKDAGLTKNEDEEEEHEA